jgi:hypothetical protein
MRFSIVCLNDEIVGDDPIDPEIERVIDDYLRRRMRKLPRVEPGTTNAQSVETGFPAS